MCMTDFKTDRFASCTCIGFCKYLGIAQYRADYLKSENVLP